MSEPLDFTTYPPILLKDIQPGDQIAIAPNGIEGVTLVGTFVELNGRGVSVRGSGGHRAFYYAKDGQVYLIHRPTTPLPTVPGAVIEVGGPAWTSLGAATRRVLTKNPDGQRVCWVDVTGRYLDLGVDAAEALNRDGRVRVLWDGVS